MLQKKTEYNIILKLFSIKQSRDIKKINLANLIFLDMLQINSMWRHIKGYPCNGQTTYTNSKNSKKNKTLFNFRLEQFFSLFGKRKRNIYPTLIQAEYNNRLWFNMWFNEWLQGLNFLLKLVNSKKNTVSFDPVSLAKGQTNGYIRVGNASKLGKSKKITKQCTIGVPLFFSKYIYMDNLPLEFPYRLLIADNIRKKMGKKNKKNKKNCYK